MVAALQHCLLFTALPLVVLGAVKRATPSSFQLYAYGDGIGGLPMFNADGYAYIGDPNLSNSTEAATVTFSPGSNNAWMGSPNTTDLTNSTHSPDWANVTLFIPSTSSSDSRVGFLDSGNSSDTTHITTGFVFYGSTAMWNDDGTLETMWTGLPVGSTGVHALYWNDTSSGQVPLTIRRIAPSNPSERMR